MRALGGNRQPSKLPSIPQQIVNVAGASARALTAAVRGQPVMAPPHIVKMREEICLTCEENLYGRCKKCGCGVRAQFLRKTHLATEQCPLDPPKWLKL